MNKKDVFNFLLQGKFVQVALE